MTGGEIYDPAVGWLQLLYSLSLSVCLSLSAVLSSRTIESNAHGSQTCECVPYGHQLACIKHLMVKLN